MIAGSTAGHSKKACSRVSNLPPGDAAAAAVTDAAGADAGVAAALRRLARAELVARFKAATLTWGGRDWRSCWIEWQGEIYSIDEAFLDLSGTAALHHAWPAASLARWA